MSCHLLVLDSVPIIEQLRLEEALLRTDQRNWCLINSGSSPSVVMGMSAVVEEVVDLSCLKRLSLPLIRRFSGGGTVVVDESTVFCTFIFNSLDIACAPTPSAVMQWSHGLLQPVFEPHRFILQEHDYVIDDLKVGGNAQCFSKGRVLHHTSFLFSWKEERMVVLRMPQKAPEYRLGRPHTCFCNRLEKYFPCQHSFQSALIKRVRDRFSVSESCLEEAAQSLDKPHRRSLQVIL